MTEVMLVGPMTGYSSYPVVMRGLHRGLVENGIDVVPVDTVGPSGRYDGVTTKALLLGNPPRGAPRTALVIRPTPSIAPLVTKHGMRLVGLHVGDVDRVPDEWSALMGIESLVVVPSTWMQKVVKETSGFDAFVAPHGVEDEYLIHEPLEAPSRGPFRFLHLCSAGVFPERKGTSQALEALRGIQGATVTLVVSELRLPLKKLLGSLGSGVRDHVNVVTRPYGIPPNGMIELYREHHALLAPSRAEGFGICPLEARALGVPVVQTGCTGFSDGVPPPESGVVIVPSGPLCSGWGDFGLAPEVRSEDVAEAMRHMMKSYDDIKERARMWVHEVRSTWSWTAVSRGLAQALREVDTQGGR